MSQTSLMEEEEEMELKTSKIGGTLMRSRGLLLAGVVAALLAGCSDSTGPSGAGRRVSLTVGLAGGAANPAPPLFAQGLVLTDGAGNRLEITSAELVIREIEFKRVETAVCDPQLGDDGCEEFKTDPTVISLPLDGTTEKKIEAVVEEGSYREIEFDIHKLDESDPVDRGLLTTRPELANVSIRVAGSYNGGPDFVYTSDLDEEQEVELVDPLVVTADPGSSTGAANVTLIIDLDSWFRDGVGTLIDPETALKGQPNEGLVTNNIKASLEGFRDDDGDGVRHSDDDDEVGD
jgi:hypothetical protein